MQIPSKTNKNVEPNVELNAKVKAMKCLLNKGFCGLLPVTFWRSLGWAFGTLWMVLGVVLGYVTPAQAHGDRALAVPEQPGLRFTLAVASSQLDTRDKQVLPSNRLTGFLLLGDEGIDRRGTSLEHGTVEAGWRIHRYLAAYVAQGWHGTDPGHLEELWLQGLWQDESGNEDGQLTVGRQKPNTGKVLRNSGHFDSFALAPLAKRMAVNDDWYDDGVQLSWRKRFAQGQWGADIGFWRGAVFPSNETQPPTGLPVPVLHLGFRYEDWEIDGFWAKFTPQGRGSRVVGLNAGHSHTAPSCQGTLAQVVCFSGSSEVMGASIRWSSHQLPIAARAALWQRQESGELSGNSGTAQYQGKNIGYWGDVLWRATPWLEIGGRQEYVMAEHRLQGTVATLLATQSGLLSYQPVGRSSVMLGFLPANWMGEKGEAGVEIRLEVGQEIQGRQRVDYYQMRLLVRLEYLR